ncbi:MAG: NifU family protein [Firmicutes bacterium]|nr:NifU family protein [Bacillota bacterium]
MLKEKVGRIIKSKVRPYLLSHGGDLEVLDFKDGIARINLLGQCKHCISSDNTVKKVIEKILIEELPEIKKVVVENQTNKELLDEAKKILNK